MFEEKVVFMYVDLKFSNVGVLCFGILKLWMFDGLYGVCEEIGFDMWKLVGCIDDFVIWMLVFIVFVVIWNFGFVYDYVGVIVNEVWQCNKNIMLGLGLNIQWMLFNGCIFEYFGEDFWLILWFVVVYVCGMQVGEVVVCVKYFVVNNQEVECNLIDVVVDECMLCEIYLLLFEVMVWEVGVLLVMGVYNKFCGQFCCYNDYLLN